MSEMLSINSDMFVVMREQFDTVLKSIVQLLEAGDEGEINIKVGVDKRYEYEYDDVLGEEVTKQRLNAEWDITRVIKAKKYKVEGRVMDDYYLQSDDDGEITVIKVEQVSMFDGQGNKVVEMRR